MPTIDGGKSRVKVPAGSQTGKQMRLRAKGMPALRGGGQGDMLIEMAVETPVNLTSRQKETPARVRKAERGQQPGKLDLLFQGQDVLGWDEGLRPALAERPGGRLPRTPRGYFCQDESGLTVSSPGCASLPP